MVDGIPASPPAAMDAEFLADLGSQQMMGTRLGASCGGTSEFYSGAHYARGVGVGHHRQTVVIP